MIHKTISKSEYLYSFWNTWDLWSIWHEKTILHTKWFLPLTPPTQHISKFCVEFYNSKWIFKVLVSSQQFIKSYNYAKETLELQNIKIF